MNDNHEKAASDGKATIHFRNVTEMTAELRGHLVIEVVDFQRPRDLVFNNPPMPELSEEVAEDLRSVADILRRKRGRR